MEHIADQEYLTGEGEFCQSFSENRKLSVVAKNYHTVAAFVVRDEGAVVWEHHVCGARVSAAVIVISDASKDSCMRQIQLMLDEVSDQGTRLGRGRRL